MPYLKKRYFSKTEGQVLAEILIAIGVFAVAITSIISVIFLGARGSKESINSLLAINLVKEYQEAASVVGQNSWNSIGSATTSPSEHYKFSLSGTTWQITYIGTSTETVTLQQRTYQRYAYFVPAQRDSSGNIVESGGTVDPATMKITVVVSWPEGENSQSFYLTRWSNSVFNQTVWKGGKGQGGPLIYPNDRFATSSSINYTTTPGAIRLCQSGEICD